MCGFPACNTPSSSSSICASSLSRCMNNTPPTTLEDCTSCIMDHRKQLFTDLFYFSHKKDITFLEKVVK